MSGRSPFEVPIATYRLQLSGAFTFDQVTAILPYLARFGVSHVYASPFLKARTGSTHGYDVVDYNRLNPELGGEAGFERFCAALETNGMGLILDFVPNHMGVGKADNPWWLDVLEWGQASPYSFYFDIDLGGASVRDKKGLEVDSLEAVRNGAISALSDAAIQTPSGVNHSAFVVGVRDENDNPVLRVTLALDVEWVRPT